VLAAAEDNGVDIAGRRLRWALTLAARSLQATLSNSERLTRNRRAEADRLAKKLGAAAVEDFMSPPPATFVKGVGPVSIAEFDGTARQHPAVVMHVQTASTTGRRVDICLFGSIDNLRGFESHDGFHDGWTSSAARAIDELLSGRGKRNTSQWDEQALAVEAVRLAQRQGMIGHWADHADHPEIRGYTIGHGSNCQFMGQVYSDVVLDPDRWDLAVEMPGADRIIVGRPLWVRTMHNAAIVRYADLRTATRTRRRGRQPGNQ
jgi:hypothetical protein